MNAIATRPLAGDRPFATGQADPHWLKRYYALRATVSVLWIALAVTVGRNQPVAGAVLFLAYPLWDCVANVVDARRSGGLRANPSQLLNAVVSAIVTVAVGVALTHSVPAAVGVIGVWAGLSGILQLSTGVRRWREARAQWPQILSGAQSCFAAVHFVGGALHPVAGVTVASISPYVAFGAFYFAISAALLAIKRR